MNIRLRVFWNRVLNRIFGPKRDEVIGGWRKMHNEELPNLHCSPSIMRIIEMGRTCSMHGEKRNSYRILVGKQGERNHPKDLDVGARIILK
jgi:hypothetical protein